MVNRVDTQTTGTCLVCEVNQKLSYTWSESAEGYCNQAGIVAAAVTFRAFYFRHVSLSVSLPFSLSLCKRTQ